MPIRASAHKAGCCGYRDEKELGEEENARKRNMAFGGDGGGEEAAKQSDEDH